MRERVLVIEDDDVGRTLLEYIFRDAGYKVKTSVSGEDALAKLAAGDKCDVAVVDILLPGMDGFEFVSCLRKKFPYCNIPIIAVTALNKRTILAMPGMLEADEIYFKPLKDIFALPRAVSRLFVRNRKDQA